MKLKIADIFACIIYCLRTKNVVGRPKANVITASREAIRTKNIEALTRIILSGAT